MYESFFSLNEPPFNVTPDPKFLFLSKEHEEVFSHLLYGISERKGFLLITGEIGTGKTTICRALLNKLDEKTKTALILNPDLNEIELLQAINEDFGIYPIGNSKKELLDSLNNFLLEQLASGENAVLIIDEAQNLTPFALEQIRMISNLETEKEKLLQIVFVGQPELRDKLDQSTLRQLNQRIAIRYHLYPLNFQETSKYILHRSKVAGGTNEHIKFTNKGLEEIFYYTQGYPRLINILCDRSLLAAYAEGTIIISQKIVGKAASDLKGEVLLKDRQEPSYGTESKNKIAPFIKITFAVIITILLATNILLYTRNIPKSADIKVNNKSEASETMLIKNKNQSAVTALTTLLNIWKINYTANEAELGTFDDKNFNSLDTFLSKSTIINQYQFEIKSIPLDLEKIKVLNYPCIIKIQPQKSDEAYYTVLESIKNDKAIITNPSLRKIEYHLDDLKKIWRGTATIIWKNVIGIDVNLKEGVNGSEVMKLQEYLKKLDYFKETPDGYFNKQTKKAVQNFQKDNQLKVDGVVGSETKMTISRLFSKSYVPSLVN